MKEIESLLKLVNIRAETKAHGVTSELDFILYTFYHHQVNEKVDGIVSVLIPNYITKSTHSPLSRFEFLMQSGELSDWLSMIEDVIGEPCPFISVSELGVINESLCKLNSSLRKYVIVNDDNVGIGDEFLKVLQVYMNAIALIDLRISGKMLRYDSTKLKKWSEPDEIEEDE